MKPRLTSDRWIIAVQKQRSGENFALAKHAKKGRETSSKLFKPFERHFQAVKQNKRCADLTESCRNTCSEITLGVTMFHLYFCPLSTWTHLHWISRYTLLPHRSDTYTHTRPLATFIISGRLKRNRRSNLSFYCLIKADYLQPPAYRMNVWVQTDLVSLCVLAEFTRLCFG